MSKRWFNNFLAVCVVALFCTALLSLGGCAIVEVEKKIDGTFVWKSKTLWKDIEEVDASDAKAEGFKFKLGRSSNSMTDAQANAIACLSNPAACK